MRSSTEPPNKNIIDQIRPRNNIIITTGSKVLLSKLEISILNSIILNYQVRFLKDHDYHVLLAATTFLLLELCEDDSNQKDCGVIHN